MDEEMRLRGQLVKIGKKLYDRHLTCAAGGSVSAKLSEKEVLIKPSGFALGDLLPEQIVKVNFKGEVIEGAYKPSTDTPWHVKIYENRPEVKAIVHAHPPICGAFACAGVTLDIPTFTEVIIQVGKIPLMEYATPTTMEYARLVADSIMDTDALLMKNHGTITLGANLEQAFQRTELLEDFAKLLLVAKLLGGPKELPPEEAHKLRTLESEKWRIKLAGELYK